MSITIEIPDHLVFRVNKLCKSKGIPQTRAVTEAGVAEVISRATPELVVMGWLQRRRPSRLSD